MASFATECNSVSHGPDEFFAVDGVVEIPDDKVVLFADCVAGGLITLVTPGEPVAVEPVEQAHDEPKVDKAGKGKKKS